RDTTLVTADRYQHQGIAMDAAVRGGVLVALAGRSMVATVVACLAAGVVTSAAVAQSWQRVLPFRAGAIRATAGGSSDVLFALSDTHLWQSSDDGLTWDSSPVSQPPGLVRPLRVGLVGILPTDPVTLYSASTRRVHVSRDLGETWDAGVSPFEAFPEMDLIHGAIVSRANPDRIVVSATGRPCCEGGLYATVDDRGTWISLTPRPGHAPGFMSFVHPNSGRGYGTYWTGNIHLVEVRPSSVDFRTLAVTFTGTAYGFDSTDSASVLVVGRAVGVIQVRRVESDEVVSLEAPKLEVDARFSVKSVAFHGETGSYFVAMRISGSDRISLIATTDFGNTWVEHGSIEVAGTGSDVYQLHFLEGSPGLFMRTPLDWYRLRLEPTPPDGLLSVKWAALKRR
ncbi:MAG: hypothetical protein ABGY41_02210, partial [Candidatus Poribacteria bacterium]